MMIDVTSCEESLKFVGRLIFTLFNQYVTLLRFTSQPILNCIFFFFFAMLLLKLNLYAKSKFKNSSH